MRPGLAAIVVALLVPRACGSAGAERAVSAVAAEPVLELSLAWEAGGHAPGGPVRLGLVLRNTGASEVVLIARVDTPRGRHFDPFRLEIAEGAGGRVRRVEFVRPRTAATRVACLLEPGQALVEHLDLAERLDPPLEAGAHRIRASYSVRSDEPPATEWGRVDALGACARPSSSQPPEPPRPVWAGHIESPPIEIDLATR